MNTTTTLQNGASSYTDHSLIREEPLENNDLSSIMTLVGDRLQPSFAVKLHLLLEEVETTGLANVVSWRSHGRWALQKFVLLRFLVLLTHFVSYTMNRCFKVHEKKRFENEILPR